MATNDSIPPPCNPEIFRKGKPIAALYGQSNSVERWVKAVAELAEAQIDWHYSGGIAQVLYLGDIETRNRIIKAMEELSPTLDGTIFQIFGEYDPGLFRAGVTTPPPGTIGAFYEGQGGSTYIVDENQESSD